MLPSVADAPVGDAERLLIETLDGAPDRVTVVAVGSLTNLAVVLDARPDLGGRIERIVVMGGALDVPGNVESAPDAEWNLYIDPEAARRVVASGAPVLFVPLDATNTIPWTETLIRQLGATGTRARPGRAPDRDVRARFWTGSTCGTSWRQSRRRDQPRATVTIEHRQVAIDDTGVIRDDPTGRWVEVATATDALAVEEEFLRVLNGGSLPSLDPAGG